MTIGQIETVFVAAGAALGWYMIWQRRVKIRWLEQGLGRTLALVIAPIAILVMVGSVLLAKEPAPDAHAIVASIRARKQLPMAVDDVTRLDDVVATARDAIEYVYTITSPDVDMRALEEHVAKLACSEPFAPLRDHHIAVTVVYRDRQGADLARIRLPFERCNH